VTLVGLVAKNGILIVEFANKLQERGHDKMAAIREAAMTRLRPVLMTSVATVAGHFPLTLVSGPGAAARNSIGLVLVGGMTIGTIFTLFVVPSLYVLIAKKHVRASADEPRGAGVGATALATTTGARRRRNNSSKLLGGRPVARGGTPRTANPTPGWTSRSTLRPQGA
jgi:predicted RND superfamily exporter protein